MSLPRGLDLGRSIATTLRIGTVLAVAAVGTGIVLAPLDGSPGPGARPLGALLREGGADAAIAVGLLGLTLLPLATLAVAAFAFARQRERLRLLIALVALGLLAVSLVAAWLLARPI